MKVKRRHTRMIVDGNYLGCMTQYSMDRNLRTSDGIKTNVIYGFLNTISGLKCSYPDLDFVFVWDSRNSLRKEIFPGYKQKRHKNLTPEEIAERKEMFKQLSVLRKRILPEIGFRNNFMADGYEGDDIIASLIQNDKYATDTIIFATDKDLYQLLSDNVRMLKKDKIYTSKDFCDEYGISPSDWWRVKAIGGCSSDEVPGIEGIGEKTVCKYLNRKLNEKTKTYQKICDNREEVEKRNTPLVKLPFEGTPVFDISDDEFNPQKTEELFEYYEFESFLDDWESWEIFWK